MHSKLALMVLALLGNFNVALAGPCKPHATKSLVSVTTTTAAPSSSEIHGPLVIKNEISNGNFAAKDPNDPNRVPGYTVEGEAEIVTDEGYTGDGSKDKGCVKMSASNNPPTRKRAIGTIVSISQQVAELDTKKKYTVRFFYAVITASSINVCTLSASIAGHQFYTTTILSIGTAIDWNTVLTQTNVPSTQGAFSVAVNCPIGGIAAIYIDSIFMSNQVTPETIDDVTIDYGDDGSAATSTTGPSPVETASNRPSTGTEPLTGTFNPTSETDHTVPTTSEPVTRDAPTESESGIKSVTFDPSTSNVFTVPTLEPSSASWDGFTTVTFNPPASSALTVPTLKQSTASWDGLTSVAFDPSTANEFTVTTRDPPTLTLNPTSGDFTIPTSSSVPSGSRVCPAGSPPPGYCTPVQPQVTQLVSLPGITIREENDQPTAPRACWAFGKANTGTWGRTRESNPQQNSIADCALLCKQEGPSCQAFALNTVGGIDGKPNCWFLSDRLGITGITINAPNSLMWNDFDCFECKDCDIKNPEDLETTVSYMEPVTTSIPSTTIKAVETTSGSPSTPTLCPKCHLRSSPSSDLVCQKIGNLRTGDLEPFANNDFDKATMQTNSEQCATICSQLDGCAASTYDYARMRCLFTNTAITSSVYQVAQDQNPSAYILPWSSQGCWSCSTDCSIQGETTSQDLTSVEFTAEPSTITPTRTEPPTTFISSYASTTTESSMPACTLALSDGCTFDQNDYNYSDCSKSGAFKKTFTLRDGEYPWQEFVYQNCEAICNQISDRCKASAWDQTQNKCVFSGSSIFSSSFTPGNGDSSLNWNEQSCFMCFCHDQDRDAYSASLITSLPQATCAPSITSEDAVCELKSSLPSGLVCQHEGYFPWQWDDVPSKFPNQDSEARCAALCNANPDCQASGWSEEYGKCAIGGWQLSGISWQQFGDNKLSWSDKGCWDCSDCIKSQKWRIY
ncbi:hypothetical protein FGADI_13117 [Fusarium gaditjirri]|uniref:Apple domain-containing protein n=1 Tax=Fusarium gaditjirri TaxID=282569 RepID=A0A8H4WN87_9HYPO|nr:hypothetical protein FGADI_13117 [Fusarium gaditjirri]